MAAVVNAERGAQLGAGAEAAGRYTAQELRRSALIFKAMSHEGRIAALTFLQSGEKTVSELGEFLNLRQPAVSQVLAVLRAAGLVQTRRDGKNIYYGLATPDVLPLVALAARIEL